MIKLLAVALCLAPIAAAQAADAPPPPYQADVLRFSEILGAVAYLDGLCATPKAEDWRAKMAGLLDAQGFAGPARRPYVEAFNRGQRTFSAGHQRCNAAARSALQRYLAEGAQLADRIGQRFGRPEGVPAEPVQR